MNIAVYCRWDDGPSREHRLAEDVGRSIALAGHGLIFGGGTNGIMGAVAQAVKDYGGSVTAVTTSEWSDEAGHGVWDEVVVYPTLGERKAFMDTYAEAVIVLPGSVGTLAELFVSMEHSCGRRPIVVVDPWGYYEGLIHWLPLVVRPGLMPSWVRTVPAAMELVETAEGVPAVR
jgi:uncharacterized protein (TIGR00730 family)